MLKRVDANQARLMLVPVTLHEANDFVQNFHRHCGRTPRDGGKFAIGVSTGDRLVGVAIVGNPLASGFMDGFTAEVTRLCVGPETIRNAASLLYGACWRAWRAMGGRRLVTYTLQSESGASLRGAGWRVVAELKPRGPGNSWDSKQDHLVRYWKPIYGQAKFRWEAPSG